MVIARFEIFNRSLVFDEAATSIVACSRKYKFSRLKLALARYASTFEFPFYEQKEGEKEREGWFKTSRGPKKKKEKSSAHQTEEGGSIQTSKLLSESGGNEV